MIEECKYLYADWCHHPDFEQELCGYYHNQKGCKYYVAKVR